MSILSQVITCIPLSLTKRRYFVNILLEHGADPNLEKSGVNSCLMHTVRYGDPVLVKTLLEASAETTHIGHNGYTVLHVFFATFHRSAGTALIIISFVIISFSMYAKSKLKKYAIKALVMIDVFFYVQFQIEFIFRTSTCKCDIIMYPAFFKILLVPKYQSVWKTIQPDHIILTSSQSIFALLSKDHVFSRNAANTKVPCEGISRKVLRTHETNNILSLFFKTTFNLQSGIEPTTCRTFLLRG